MPTFDGGHAFFTALIPLRTDPLPRDDGPPQDRAAALREALSLLPVARQSPASDRPDMPESPFARVPTTHFARLLVIDDPIFNGRDPQDALSNSVFGPDLTVPIEAADHLSTAYLFVSGDIDAPQESEGEIDAWLSALWRTSEAEMTTIFRHCRNFDGVVRTAEDFARYVRRGGIDTTMSFNDYFEGPPPLKAADFKSRLAAPVVGALIAAIGIGGVAAVTASAVLGRFWGPFLILAGALLYLGWLYRRRRRGGALFAGSILEAAKPLIAGGKAFASFICLLGLANDAPPPLDFWAWCLMLGLAIGGIGGAHFIWWTNRTGAKSLPAAPNSDLKSILKALHLQRRFTRFAIDQQGAAPEDLHKAFGAFLQAEKPSDTNGPTQSPGVVGASLEGTGR